MGSTSRRSAQPNSSANALLRSYAERIVRLKEEIKALQGDIKDVRNEAGAQGFDKKALMIVVSRMMEDEVKRASRQETEALADIYLASLGMLDGTPLGDAARRRMDEPSEPDLGAPEPDSADDFGGDPDGARDGDSPPAAAQPPSGAMSQEQIDGARTGGEEAAAAGRSVLSNPYVAGDPRRAAWDEGWCRYTGSDGMDLPPAFRRKPKKPHGGADNPQPGGEQ